MRLISLGLSLGLDCHVEVDSDPLALEIIVQRKLGIGREGSSWRLEKNLASDKDGQIWVKSVLIELRSLKNLLVGVDILLVVKHQDSHLVSGDLEVVWNFGALGVVNLQLALGELPKPQIGRASCRERVF